jgi:glyoxylase-like metal-dependent hydrolase (beta-lactamase superfamily II)
MHKTANESGRINEGVKTMISLRRILFIALFLVVADSAVSQDANTVEVADGVYSYGDPALGYFSMFVVTDEGVIAIEPVNTSHSRGLVEAIQSVTDQPIRYLLHSHNHWDHSGGGQVFRDEGATIIAHVEAYEWMSANPHPDMALPDESWGGSRKDVVLGRRTVELYYFGMSHGLGMTVFLVPAERIAYIADIVTPKRLLFAIVPDFNIREWERTLGQIEMMDFDRAIFSHNNNSTPRQGGTKQDVTETREFIGDLRAAIHAEIENGTNPFAAPNVVRLPKYESWAMYDEWLAMNALRVFLDEHMGPFPWRPD